MVSKWTIQFDCGNIQNGGHTDPYPIGYEQQSGFFRDAPKAHHQKHDGQPQKNHFKDGPVWALQLEVDGTPQNVQKSVDAKQKNYSFFVILALR